MREVQDHYFRLAKDEGYLSRAAYKLIEIDQRKHVLRKGDRVLDCGCAPGSWLQVASKVVGPRGVVVGIDLHKVPRKIADNVVTVEGDFTLATPDELMQCIGDGRGQSGERGRSPVFDVVLSDMAPKTTGDPESDHFRSVRLCESVLDRCPDLLRVGGNLVMKVFEGSGYMDLVRRTERLFEDAKGFSPKASRSESREMYLVAHGWRGLDWESINVRPTDVTVLAPPKPASSWNTPKDSGRPA